MNPTLSRLLDDRAGDYLGADDRRTVLDYGSSLPARFQASDAVRDAEDDIIRGALDELRSRHGGFLDSAPRVAEEILPADLRQVLRYTVTAMIRDDPTLQESQLLSWLRSVRSHLNLPPGLLPEACAALRDGVRESVPEESFALLEPFLQINIDRLGAGERAF